ncbi:4-alpha-glucanotransferase [Bibersteinia trehalosi]|uniref:4-alpha-glucanotransferase n=1 Tax=Bibersteinia trehalosi TaxID=47735 RepID=UPI003984E292
MIKITMETQDYFFDGFNSAFATHQAVAQLLGQAQVQALLPPVQVVEQGQAVEIPLNFTNFSEWQLQLETGEVFTGIPENGRIVLPSDLPLGYHEVTLADAQCRLIITPKTAYQPKEILAKKKLWGAILQLYTLRSEQNWGIGDFGDLAQFLTYLARQGGDFVGLNPIHSLFPANPEAASPYSPSSRLWQNILYIDVTAIPAFQNSLQAQEWFQQPETQQKLNAARTCDYISYSLVTQLKLQGLALAYEQFKQEDQIDFEQFIVEKGEQLKIQGTFDALHQWLSEQYPAQWGWSNWASEWQDYTSPQVADFQQQQPERIRFYMWLQFIASQQLKACYELAKQLNMPIGFYRDLAVGVANNGAETWSDKSLYVLGASIGAPPDMLAPQGQNWGLSPMHPSVLQARAYQPFIDLLRANMQDCGALRIDHILGLMRLWWVLQGGSAVEGVYIRYPFEDLLGILALESQRHQCLIIAEALGTVPEGILEALEQKGILAYNVFYFEFEDGKSKPLSHYPYQAMTTLSTHDLPTINGYWQEYDIALGQHYDIYPSQAILDFVQENRSLSKKAFCEVLAKVGILASNDKMPISSAFNHQLQSYVAYTNSALYATQPEDWLNMLEPVNIPGTSSEHPNWRRKLSKSITTIFSDESILALLNSIRQNRT